MVGYMSLEEQVDKDFSFTRRKALLRRIGARLRRDVGVEEVRRSPPQKLLRRTLRNAG